MSLTVGEVKENYEYNLSQGTNLHQCIGNIQKQNYEIAKELGADDDDNWYDWVDEVTEYKKENNIE